MLETIINMLFQTKTVIIYLLITIAKGGVVRHKIKILLVDLETRYCSNGTLIVTVNIRYTYMSRIMR